jgi:alpha-glucosidase (family GH31 glycosyl hydrolase)
MARRFFQLRYSLVPYLYTYCREAYDTGLPLCRPLYLEYPKEPEAYRRSDEYLLGRELLVAPVTSPAVAGIATRSIWFPPGQWVDWFTRDVYPGDRTVDYDCPLERMPLFVRRGSILPRQPDMAYTGESPLDPLILDVYPGGAATFSVYGDDGLSMEYVGVRYQRTPVRLSGHEGCWRLTIGRPQGEYAGMRARKQYEVRLHVGRKPGRVTVNGITRNATWDAANSVATVLVAAAPQGGGRQRPIAVTFPG